MQFKVKDTLVTVLPRAEAVADLNKICLWRTRICLHPTLCAQPTYCLGCTLHITCLCSHRSFGCGFGNSCGPGGSACDPTAYCIASDPFVIQDLEDLVALRGELQETLKRLGEIEASGLASGIRSKAEAEELERSLNEALEQVRTAKKSLK
jgi:hypothetical protein